MPARSSSGYQSDELLAVGHQHGLLDAWGEVHLVCPSRKSIEELGHDVDPVPSEGIAGHDDAFVWHAAQAARRVSDAQMLRLIARWLKAPVVETDERGNRRMRRRSSASQRRMPNSHVLTWLAVAEWCVQRTDVDGAGSPLA